MLLRTQIDDKTGVAFGRWQNFSTLQLYIGCLLTLLVGFVSHKIYLDCDRHINQISSIQRKHSRLPFLHQRYWKCAFLFRTMASSYPKCLMVDLNNYKTHVNFFVQNITASCVKQLAATHHLHRTVWHSEDLRKTYTVHVSVTIQRCMTPLWFWPNDPDLMHAATLQVHMTWEYNPLMWCGNAIASACGFRHAEHSRHFSLGSEVRKVTASSTKKNCHS